MADAEIKARILAAFEAVSAGKTRPYLDLFSDDVVWRVTGTTRWSGTYRGKGALVNDLLLPVSTRLDGPFRATVRRIVVEGDLVVVESKGENLTKSGKRYDNEYCWVCRMKDGKLTEVTEYLDTDLVNSALGGQG